jgi:putative tributyrin esterase
MKFRTLEKSDPTLMLSGMQCVTVKSSALKQRADTTIFLPPEFSHLRNLPIVTLLHGVFGSHWSWTYQGGAHLLAAELMRQGDISPMVLIMPSDGLWGDGSGYVAHTHAYLQQDFEKWIVDEVPEIATQTCPSCSQQSMRFIAGLSMGGFAALRLAGVYPDRYQAASGHSALTEISQIDALIEESREEWAKEATSSSVLAALNSSQGKLPALRFDCGQSDIFLKANQQLHQSLLELGIAHEYEEFEGGHDWPYWRTHLANTLRFFSRTLHQSTSK